MIWAKTGDDEVAKVPGNPALIGGGQGASVGQDDQLHCQEGHQTRLEAPQLRGAQGGTLQSRSCKIRNQEKCAGFSGRQI